MWPIAFVVAAVTHGAVAEPVASHAWYRFEESTDLARNVGTHPLPASLPKHGVKQAAGPVGQALELDGNRGHGLKVPSPHLIFGDEAVSGTVMLWVRPSFDVAADTREQVLFSFTPRTANTRVDGYEIVAVMTGEKFRVQPQIRPRVNLKTPLTQGRWTHLALTWHVERGAAFYVDGKRAGGFKSRFKPVKLGRFAGWIGHHGTCGRPFQGAIDEVHLFDRMLSGEEMAALVKADPDPQIKVLKWREGAAEIVNIGDRPQRVWLREYRDAEPLLTAGSAQLIPPNGRAVVPPPQNPMTLGARRLGAMVGSGDTAVECAHEIHAGLQWRLEPRKRVFFSDESIVLGVVITNDTGSRYDGTLVAGLTDWDGRAMPSRPPKSVKVEQGQRTSIRWEVSSPLAIGAYHLTVSAVRPDGEPEALGSVNLVSTKREAHRDIFTVATTFHRGKEDVWLRAKADGATVFRWGAGYRPDMRYHEELTDTLGRIGCKNYVNVHPIRGCPVDRSLPGVQGTARYVCLSHPEVHEAIRGMSEIVAKYYRHNPVTPVVFVEGELPCHAADYAEVNTQAFRTWLKTRYRDLDALNREWRKQYQSWDEIEQIGSPKDVDAAAHSKMWMTRELPKKTTARFKALAQMDPTRAIEWRRWHQSVIDHAYRIFVDEFHRHNRVTGIGTNPCWPNFHPHVLFRWGRLFTVAGIDPYLPGTLPQDLGHPSELMESIDMTASIYQGKPLWVNELYDLSTYPPRVPEAQGWFLVGHGYSLMTYFTYNYYYEGQRGGKPLEFGLFDKQGEPYATYPSFQRFSKDMRAFHERYDAHSLRRERPRVAIFLADANSTAGWLETGGETWAATAVLAHIGTHWLTRQCGYPVEFINEQLWDRLEGMRALIVPWTELARQADLTRVVEFARNGGTVILDGPVGTYDELWRPVGPRPGGAALAALGVRYRDWQREKGKLALTDAAQALGLEPGTEIPCLGALDGVSTGSAGVLARDATGVPLLVRCKVGQGQVYWLLANIGLGQRGNQPDANALALWRALLSSAGLSPRSAIVGSSPASAGAKKAARDVALRIKGDRELFVFVTSFLGPTQGSVKLGLPDGDYLATDARTQQLVRLEKGDAVWRLPLDLPAFGTGVFLIRATSGPAFGKW